MKTTIFILLIALIGCGSDNPVNNSTNPPSNDTTVLLTKDSIYAGSPYQGRDSVEYFCTNNVDTVYCSFNLYSQNVTGVLIKLNDLDSMVSLPSTYNQNYLLKLPANTSNFNIKLWFALMGATPPSYYASLRNIKLYSISR
jgi:hypothetical protein